VRLARNIVGIAV